MTEIRRPFRQRIGSAGFALAALCVVSAAGFAQRQNPPAGGGKLPGNVVGDFSNVHAVPPGGPAPRLADQHVDMSGLWYPNNAGRMLEGAYQVDRDVFRQFDPKATPEPPLLFKPGMAAKYKSPVPYGMCDQAGTPSSITMQANQHGPLWITQKPGMFIIMIEYPLTVRMIHTDGRPHTKNPDPTFNGDSSAHWEGDTLVVDVIAIDDRLRNVAVGFAGESGAWLHSDQEHIVERFTRSSKNYMTYQVTIDDPVVLAKPWTSAPRSWTLGPETDDWQEYFCTHNEEPDEYKKLGSPKLEPPNFNQQ
jgi:hypothetical protein